MAGAERQTAFRCSGISVTTSSQVLVADNPNRYSIVIKNDSGVDVYFKFRTTEGVNPTATADAQSLKLANGASFATDDYSGPIAFIAGSAATVTILEL